MVLTVLYSGGTRLGKRQAELRAEGKIKKANAIFMLYTDIVNAYESLETEKNPEEIRKLKSKIGRRKRDLEEDLKENIEEGQAELKSIAKDPAKRAERALLPSKIADWQGRLGALESIPAPTLQIQPRR
jgi:gas vesicle protein